MASDVAGRLGGRFASLWAASTTSALGSGLATIAAPLFVAAHTKNPVIVAAGFAVAWLPWLLFALPGGVLVDRVDRRRLMIALDWTRFAAMTLLAVAVLTGRASIAMLYAVLFIVNTGEVVFRSAGQAMVASVVPRTRLERANGWLTGGAMLMQRMVAGPLGGFLFVVAASVPFVVNAGTYAASAILIGTIGGGYLPRQSQQPKVKQGQSGLARSVWSDIAVGFRWLAGQRILRTMAVLIGLLNITLTASTAVLVLLARQRLHLNSVGYGLLFTCMAAGGIVGSAIGDRLIRRVSATWTIRIGLLIEAGLHLTLASSRNAYLIGVMFFAFGMHGALWGIVGSSLRQRLTPPDMLGRVGSTTFFVAAGGNCAGALIGGLLAARFGITAPYWVAFVVALIVAVSTWRVFSRPAVAAAYASSSTVGETGRAGENLPGPVTA